MTDHCNARYSMALWRCVDVMRRCDPEYVASHSQQPATDAQWDAALELAEEVLDELSTDDAQRDLFNEDVYQAQTARLAGSHDD